MNSRRSRHECKPMKWVRPKFAKAFDAHISLGIKQSIAQSRHRSRASEKSEA